MEQNNETWKPLGSSKATQNHWFNILFSQVQVRVTVKNAHARSRKQDVYFGVA